MEYDGGGNSCSSSFWGSLRITGVLLLIFFPTICVGQNGKQLFHKMQTALGGSDKIATIGAFDQCVRADAWGDDGKFYGVVYKRTRWIKPNLLRLDQAGLGNSYVLYFDGKSGWEILPDKGFVQLSGDELSYARGYLNGVNLNAWLADRDPHNNFTAISPNMISISSDDDDSGKTEMTLDPSTFLPIKETVITTTKGNRRGTKTREFEKWETFQGVKFPRRIINFHGDQKVADIKLQYIKAADQTADLSIKPDNLKPQMSGCVE